MRRPPNGRASTCLAALLATTAAASCSHPAPDASVPDTGAMQGRTLSAIPPIAVPTQPRGGVPGVVLGAPGAGAIVPVAPASVAFDAASHQLQIEVQGDVGTAAVGSLDSAGAPEFTRPPTGEISGTVQLFLRKGAVRTPLLAGGSLAFPILGFGTRKPGTIQDTVLGGQLEVQWPDQGAPVPAGPPIIHVTLTGVNPLVAPGSLVDVAVDLQRKDFKGAVLGHWTVGLGSLTVPASTPLRPPSPDEFHLTPVTKVAKFLPAVPRLRLEMAGDVAPGSGTTLDSVGKGAIAKPPKVVLVAHGNVVLAGTDQSIMPDGPLTLTMTVPPAEPLLVLGIAPGTGNILEEIWPILNPALPPGPPIFRINLSRWDGSDNGTPLDVTYSIDAVVKGQVLTTWEGTGSVTIP